MESYMLYSSKNKIILVNPSPPHPCPYPYHFLVESQCFVIFLNPNLFLTDMESILLVTLLWSLVLVWGIKVPLSADSCSDLIKGESANMKKVTLTASHCALHRRSVRHQTLRGCTRVDH